jgi:hypothetical protein
MKTTTAITLKAAAVILGLGGIVYATIPDSEGVIHACYGADGHLRVIDDAIESCRPNEQSLTWQQQGGGITGYIGVVSQPFPVPPHSRAEGSVNCPAGTNVLSGGVREEVALGQLVMIALTYAPLSKPDQVGGAMRNDTDGERRFFVEAICAKVD